MQAFSGTLTSLVIFLALCAGSVLAGVFFRRGDWYAKLDKPSWTPPGWLFGLASTVLHVLVALAGWIVWNNAPTSPAVTVWFVQLALGVFSFWLFFGLRRPGVALFGIGLHGLASALFAFMVWPFQPVATALFLPWLAWIAWIFALTLAIRRRNP